MNEALIVEKQNKALNDWRTKERKALALLRKVGELRFDKGVETVLFREEIYDCRPSEIIKHHGIADNYDDRQITLDDTLDMITAIADYDELPPAKVDIGKLALEFKQVEENMSICDFLLEKLGTQFGNSAEIKPRDVILYGFGRIGRLLARRLVTMTGRGDQLRLKAIVVRPKLKDRAEELRKRTALLISDSVHGDFPGTVELDTEEETLTVNGNKIHFLFAGSPDEIDYTEYGIKNAILLDNTGVWKDKEAISIHKRPGVDKIILTAPGKNMKNIVHGINQDLIEDSDDILSAASCTTNAISPIIKVIDENYGIDKGHIETIHAYTNSQNLLDNFHKKPRRGRGAAVNMVLTTTGAAKAVTKVIPHLKGKLSGNAVRVPTPDVSLAIMNLTLEKPSSVEEINNLLYKASYRGPLVEQIHYSDSDEFVSSNAVGMTSTSIFDAPSTIVSEDGKNATLYVWYDNEYGYSCQVLRLAKHVAKVRRLHYYY